MTEYDGRVRLVFKDLPLPSHPAARGAHEAARCAGAAGKYWAYHDRLFEEQGRFAPADLVRYAVELGLDRAEFERCFESRRYAAQIDADIAQARALGVTGTPTFFVNGIPLVGAHPVETFREVIEQALRGAR
jgi:protein-disulfide isomerase